MSITINTNIASLNAQRHLTQTSNDLRASFERLSTGLRIVHPSDDPAGLSIADRLRADQRIAGVAVRNANDAISVVNIADGALDQIGNILVRMGEVAEQAGNGTLSGPQQSALNQEFVALGSEVERIANTTTFNGQALLSGTPTLQFQIGLDSSSNSQITLSGVDGTLASLGLATAGTSALKVSLVGGLTASLSALDAVKGAIGSVAAYRGTLGAAESRLTAAVNNLQVARENFASAESQIRDVDVAEEVSRLVRLSILQQAGAAVLAQANQQPALALALLGA